MTVASVKEQAKGQGSGSQPPPAGGETTTAQVVKTFPKMLELYQDEVSRALPAHLRHNIGRYARLALTEFRQNEKLALCDPRSIFASVILASQMGWELGGTLGHAYLVPYKQECQLIPGWKGLVDLAHRGGRSQIWTGAVYEGDEFEYVLGARPDLKHVPKGEDDPAKLKFTYSVGWIVGQNHPILEVWPQLKLQRHRDRYNKVGKGHYSFNNWEMYCRKVPLLQVVKYLPVSVEMSNALALDVAADTGESQGLTIQSAAEGAVFPSPWIDVKAEPPQETQEGGGQPTGQANAATPTPPPATAGKVEPPKAAAPKPAPAPAPAPTPAPAAPASPPPAPVPQAAPPVQPPAPAPAPVPSPAPVAAPAPEATPVPATQPPAWAEEPASPAPQEMSSPPAAAVVETTPAPAPSGERKKSKNPVIRKIKLPEFIDRVGPDDAPSEEQIATARAETDRLNVNLEKTVSDWTGAQLSEINTETLLVLTDILKNYHPAGK